MLRLSTALWATLATAQTASLLADVEPATIPVSSSPGGFVVMGGAAYFRAKNAAGVLELWKSDGTALGTTLVAPLPGVSRVFIVAGTSRLFLLATEGVAQLTAVWTSAGTAASTRRVADAFVPSSLNGTPPSVGVVGDRFVYACMLLGAGRQQPCVSDGTAAGTGLLKDINPAGDSQPKYFTSVGSQLVFIANDGVSGDEPWVTDGTSVGTRQLADLQPGPLGSGIGGFVPSAGRVFFAGSAPSFGIFSSDALSSGVTSVLPNQNLQYASATFKGAFYFVVNNNTTVYRSVAGGPASVAFTCPFRCDEMVSTPRALLFQWLSGVTPAGFWASTDGGSPTLAAALTFTLANEVTAFGDKLIFDAVSGPQTDHEPGVFDDVAGSAFTLKNINPAGGSTTGSFGFTALGGTVLFQADDGVTGSELWATDGTSAGTVLLKDLAPERYGVGSSPRGFVGTRGRVFFSSTTEATGRELFASSGAGTGANLFVEFIPDSGSGLVSDFGAFGGEVLACSAAPGSTLPLFAFEAFDAGMTVLRNDLRARPSNFVEAGTQEFFFEQWPGNGVNLWVTDGGTAQLVLTLPGNSAPSTAVAMGARALFWLPPAVWSSDGSDSGTVLLHSATSAPEVLGNQACFAANDTELWCTDGSLAGTRQLGQVVAGPIFAVSWAGGAPLVAVGSTLYRLDPDGGPPRVLMNALGQGRPLFLGDRAVFVGVGDAGAEPYVTDGTGPGTVQLVDLRPGGAGSSPSGFTRVGNAAYFSANDGVNGVELWRTDGTPRGTRLVQDLEPGAGSGAPARLTLVGTTLYFAATTRAAGEEPWVMPVDVTPPIIVATPSNATGWFRADVPVTFAVSDPDSAVEWTSAGCDGGLVSADTAGALFECQAASQAGISSVKVVIRRDVTPPSIACPPEVSADTTARNRPVAWGPVTATDAISSAVVSFDRDAGEPFTFPGGTVVATATDEAGNAASCLIRITLVDREPPKVSCVPEIVVEPTSAAGVVLTELPSGTITGIDVVDPASVTVELPALGQTIAVDDSLTLSAVAVDGAGNRSLPCSVNVLVQCKTEECRAMLRAPPLARSRYAFGCASAGLGPLDGLACCVALGVAFRWRRRARPMRPARL